MVCALTALCFAVLASLAATHLHLGPEADEACAVCAAVVGKVAGPSAAPRSSPLSRIKLLASGYVHVRHSPLVARRRCIAAVVRPSLLLVARA